MRKLDDFGLTMKEKQIFNFVLDGLRRKQIADKLGKHLSTVKFHITNILRKTNCDSCNDLIKQMDLAATRLQLKAELFIETDEKENKILGPLPSPNVF